MIFLNSKTFSQRKTLFMELTLTQTLFYAHSGFYYAVKGDRLVQIDEDHYLELKPGNEVYYAIRKMLSKEKPVGKSKADEVRRKLKERIDDLD